MGKKPAAPDEELQINALLKANDPRDIALSLIRARKETSSLRAALDALRAR